MDFAVGREVQTTLGWRALGQTVLARPATVARRRAPRSRGQRPAASAHRFGRSYQSRGLVGMSRSHTRGGQLRGREKEKRRGQRRGDGGRDCAGVGAGQGATLLVHGMLCAVIATRIRRSFLAARLGHARHIHACHSGWVTLVACGLSRCGGHRADEQGHHGQKGEHEAHRLHTIQARRLKSTVRMPVCWPKRRLRLTCSSPCRPPELADTAHRHRSRRHNSRRVWASAPRHKPGSHRNIGKRRSASSPS